MDREWTRIKRRLTLAEKSGDPKTIIAACDEALHVFDTIGYPDWWQRAEMMKLDAEMELAYR